MNSNTIQHRGIWKRFIHTCSIATLPWGLIALYFAGEIGWANLAVKIPQINANFFSGDADLKSITMFLIFELVSIVFGQFTLYFNHLIRYKMNRNLRNALWGKILTLKPIYFDKTSSSTLISRITVDSDSMNEFFMDIILQMGFQIYYLYLTVVEMNEISTKASFMLLAFVPLTVLISFVLGRFNLKFENAMKLKMADLTSYLSELVSCLPLLKAFNKQSYESKRGQHVIDEYYDANKKVIWLDVVRQLVGGLAGLGPEFVIIFLGIKMLNAAEIDAAGWYIFYTYAGTFIMFANELGNYWQNSKAIQGRLNKVSDILYEEPESLNEYVEEIVDSGDIIFDNVTFGYEEEPVIENASFTIPKNKHTVIIGYSGTGKSTILKLLNRMYEPTSGRIIVSGQNLNDINIRAWRKDIATVVQNTPMLSGSIRDNVLYGVDGQVADEQIFEALKLAHVDEYVQSLEEGLDHQVGQFGEQLSGGQRQKISVARAILMGTPMLVLDEPTASLDITSTAEITQTKEKLKGQKTIVEISHDAHAIMHADHIIVVNPNHSVIEGTREEMALLSEFYQNLMKGEV